MRIGINGNRLVATGDLETVVQHAARVAADGLASYWLAQHPAGALDAITALTVAGSRLPPLELATGVVPIWARHPAALAAQTRTAAQAIPGGFTLGIGTSHPAMARHHLGFDFDRITRRLSEYLQVLVPLLTTGRVDFHGDFYSCETTFPSTSTPRPSVLVAAMGEQALKLAGRHADGTVVSWTGPKTIRTHIIPVISEAAAAVDRPRPRVAAVFSVCVTDDVARAREAVQQWFDFHGRAPSYEAMIAREGVASACDLALIGPESEVEARIEELAAIGVDDLVVGEVEPPDAGEGLRTRAFLAKLARGQNSPRAGG